jgi:hypothetical protein
MVVDATVITSYLVIGSKNNSVFVLHRYDRCHNSPSLETPSKDTITGTLEG